ncbi:hypothetical protein K2173_013296 [Erythroxylum novogranatense]|uniref:BHLH domain-containing protein n=1 Tax=Erythroxylum novogranatense TaxID=1862640 RepID=A0AAV8SA07_9ROSI|nr:hypothetical protein K2173_013296 [Erythroxylum novogranatense]
MASIGHNQAFSVPDNLSKRLAVAVRSIQWSYAIFWSLSTTQQGVLEWVDGFYNGDIKTRKTVQAMELKADKRGLERSGQLRELYKSLLLGETEQQAKRHSVVLSPEDLSDAEWYYLVCMSFVFNRGQGLPGRAFDDKRTIWLCNAQFADSKVFSRSLLAKSASIQTVVCFPHFDGVIELGVTELVAEDPGLIQHIKTSLLEVSKPVCSEKSSSSPLNADDDKDPVCAEVNHEVVDTLNIENLYNLKQDAKFGLEGVDKVHEGMHEEFNLESADNCSNGCEHNQQPEDSCMLELLNDVASQVQSWHFMYDEFSNGGQDSINSSDCISEAVVNEQNALVSPNSKIATHMQPKELEEGNHTKLTSLDLDVDGDLHYRRIVSVILGGSNQFIENLCSRHGNNRSSFITWKKEVDVGHRPQLRQNMLKKILFSVPLMHGGSSMRFNQENGEKYCLKISEGGEVCKKHNLLDKQKENENFQILRSIIPSVSEIDKTSILSVTIKYLKELEARVEELESCMDSVDNEARPRRNYVEMVEQTSDNYDNKKIGNNKKSWINKRKASDIDDIDPDLIEIVPKAGLPLDVKVNMKDAEVFIDIRCPYREYILLEFMDEINKFHVDVLSVQSSTLDGILTLAITSKFRGTAIAPAGMIKQALWKIADN